MYPDMSPFFIHIECWSFYLLPFDPTIKFIIAINGYNSRSVYTGWNIYYRLSHMTKWPREISVVKIWLMTIRDSSKQPAHEVNIRTCEPLLRSISLVSMFDSTPLTKVMWLHSTPAWYQRAIKVSIVCGENVILCTRNGEGKQLAWQTSADCW